MKLLRATILTGFFLLISGCGGDGENKTAEAPKTENREKVSMKYEGKEISFEPKYAKFATIKKGLILKDSDIQSKNERVPAIVHRIYLANYDLQLTDSSKQDYRRISSDGEYRVEIQIEAEEGAAENTQPKVGEYVYKPAPFNRISYVFLSYFKDGKDRSENLQTSEFGGKIKITSVTDTEIKGEIDVFDRNEFLKAGFTAQKL
jgi:hypothetical protein